MPCCPVHLCCGGGLKRDSSDDPWLKPKTQGPKAEPAQPRSGKQRARQAQLSIRLNSGRLFLRGVLAASGRATSNGRVYPQDVLTRERRRYQECLVKLHKGLGELLHPSYDCESFSELHLSFISHQVVALWENGRQLHGIFEVLDTPAGQLVRDWYLRGGRLGASLRGSCSTTEHGINEIVGCDFELSTFDLVILPASPALMEPVMEVMALSPLNYSSQLLHLAAHAWPDQQRSVLSSWFQTGESPSKDQDPLPGHSSSRKSSSRKSLARIMPQRSDRSLPDFSSTSLQKSHSLPGPVGCSSGGRLLGRPFPKWAPGPVVSTASDLCSRAQLLGEYVRELQRRPAFE
ncbi:hypothetical protein WJX74_004126 [Apatococcus lobatus]|uniref:Uncharacterized protein n=1 Tax=Apatococcus lobatus TaxID=904363 RepID=A0AAW1SAQ5_9CHLO